MIYRFVGSTCELGNGTPLSQFGATIDLAEAQADQYVAAGAALIPAETFDAAGFTADELAKYSSTELHDRAPAEFLQKRAAVWRALHDHRQTITAAIAAKE